jgi:hypothetical protein
MEHRAGRFHAPRGADSRWREIQEVSAPESRMPVGAPAWLEQDGRQGQASARSSQATQ